MVGHRIFCMLAVAALLAGCATAAQRQYQAIGANTQAVVGGANACVTAIYSTPEAVVLGPHLPFDVRDLILAQLSDQSLATKEEIDAILVLHPRLRECQKAALDGLMSTTPSLVPILAAESNRGEDNLLLLIQHKQSWGEFSKHRRENFFEAQAQLVAEARRIEAGLEQSHEAELARRQAAAQAAADALARYAQTQQIISNMNRPVNCLTTDLGQFKTTTCQ